MPAGEGPLPTKREMLIERQSSALPCREAAQFNQALHRTAICAWGFALEFLVFICQFVAVGELVVRQSNDTPSEIAGPGNEEGCHRRHGELHEVRRRRQ